MKSRSILFVLPVDRRQCSCLPHVELPLPLRPRHPPQLRLLLIDGESEAPRLADQSSSEYAGEPVPESAELPAAPMPTSAAFEIANPSGDMTVIEHSNV